MNPYASSIRRRVTLCQNITDFSQSSPRGRARGMNQTPRLPLPATLIHRLALLLLSSACARTYSVEWNTLLYWRPRSASHSEGHSDGYVRLKRASPTQAMTFRYTDQRLYRAALLVRPPQWKVQTLWALSGFYPSLSHWQCFALHPHSVSSAHRQYLLVSLQIIFFILTALDHPDSHVVEFAATSIQDKHKTSRGDDGLYQRLQNRSFVDPRIKITARRWKAWIDVFVQSNVFNSFSSHFPSCLYHL